MNPDDPPRTEYLRRLEDRQRAVRRYEDISGQLGWIRLAVALAFVVLLWLSVFRGALTAWWLLAPALTFLALVAIHLNIREKRRRAVEGVASYEHGLPRIEDRWMGRKSGAYRFTDESHLYAPDLDIFGAGSLFELLSTARTRAGEEMLAGWLTAPACRAEIRARQEAVEELRGRIDLREDLAVLGARHRLATERERLARWATMPSVFPGQHPKIIFPLLAAMVFASLLAVWLSDTDRAWLAMYVSLSAAGLVGLFYRTRVRQTLSAAQDHAGEDRAAITGAGTSGTRTVPLAEAGGDPRLARNCRLRTVQPGRPFRAAC